MQKSGRRVIIEVNTELCSNLCPATSWLRDLGQVTLESLLRFHLLLETLERTLCCMVVLWMGEEEYETHSMVPATEQALYEFQERQFRVEL